VLPFARIKRRALRELLKEFLLFGGQSFGYGNMHYSIEIAALATLFGQSLPL
jgi:hypothetical protein